MRERDIEKSYRKKIEAVGGLCLKFVSPGFSGVPDRLVILPGGEIYMVEFKSPTGRLTVRQIRVIKKLQELGVRVEVVNVV